MTEEKNNFIFTNFTLKQTHNYKKQQTKSASQRTLQVKTNLVMITVIENTPEEKTNLVTITAINKQEDTAVKFRTTVLDYCNAYN